MSADPTLKAAVAAVPPIEPNTREDAAGTFHDVLHQLELDAIADLQAFADAATPVLNDLTTRVGVLEGAAAAGATVRTITAGFDGGAVAGVAESIRVGQVIETRVPYGVTLTGWTLLLQGATGDCTVAVRSKPFASGSFADITGGSPPSASSGANATGGVAGWTASVSAGALLQIEVTARSGLVPIAVLILEGTQS